MKTDLADAYLTISPGYGRALGGLQWSRGCDAIETEDGSTLALVHQLSAVLEGVFAAPPVPPFVFVLNLMCLFKQGGAVDLNRLKDAYTAAGSAGSGRTAGLLIAELCRGLPTATNPPSWEQLDLALKRRLLFGERQRTNLTEIPPLMRTEFERKISDRLQTATTETLTHWLQFGGPPSGSGNKVAEELNRLPVGVSTLLAEARQRPRLAGAASLTPALDAALTLPPRRPRPNRLAQGGYADVTTRGEPDRLLPSQFALDPDEFVRRFAERELLYFLREEPHRPTAPERWLVLDQGVRTWGTVRHALAAGVFAMLGRDPKKVGDTWLSLTSSGEVIHPAEATAKALADRLETSDLTPTPAAALLRAVEHDGVVNRDIILLTHPRALREPEVIDAVRLKADSDRLFALAVDEAGHAELSEWGPAGPVTVRKFRVDLIAAEAAKPEIPSLVKPAPAPLSSDAWVGDVEPIPFPFRAGLVSDVEHLGFDADGERVVAIGRDGCVQMKNLYGDGPVEVLPRAYFKGDVLTQVEAVVGVNGGVVICGRIPKRFYGPKGVISQFVTGEPDLMLVAAHYDFAVRAVKMHLLSPVFYSHPVRWWSFPELHCIVVSQLNREEPFALDLETHGRYPNPGRDTQSESITTRAKLAFDLVTSQLPSPVNLPAAIPGKALPEGPYIELCRSTLLLQKWPGKWATCQPMSEGKPLLNSARWTLTAAQLAGDVLVVHVHLDRDKKVYLLHGPSGAVLREITGGHEGGTQLNQDGSWFAIRTGTRAVRAMETMPGGRVADATNAGFHSRLQIGLMSDLLHIRVGRNDHTFTLTEFSFRHERATPVWGTGMKTSHAPAGYGTSELAYDRERFLDPVRAGPWTAAFDRWGQVVLLGPNGKLVLTIAVRRELVAAWLPDGTRWGSAALLGGPADPEAALRIGHALQMAAEGKS